MTLGFSQQINGKTNWFVEKIWKHLWDSNHQEFLHTSADYEREYNRLNPVQFVPEENIHYHKPKLHTIREDKHDRWKAGCFIHPVINNRTANRFQFAPVMKCVSVQVISIKWFECVDDSEGELFEVQIDGRVLNLAELILLSQNDGFESLADFKDYFNKDFTGKIIHWTDLKY